MTTATMTTADIRSGKPRPAPLPAYAGRGPGRLWCIIGGPYGYVHTISGEIRAWGSRSGAYAAIRRLF